MSNWGGCPLMNSKSFEELLPPIKPMDLVNISDPLIYMGAVGFEDRAFAYLNDVLKLGKRFDRVIAVEYKPLNKRNKKEEYQKKLEELDIPDENVEWIVYHRYRPEEFLRDLNKIREIISLTSNVVIDISAMSKLLIMVLLQGLRDLDINLTLVYAEAEVYHPIGEKFEAERKKHEKETETLPTFLTTGLYDIVTTTSLSTTAMQGYPLMMIGFPTFNHRELTALVNEITPQHLVLLDGRPHEADNHWRLDAIRWLNRKIRKEFSNGDTVCGHGKVVSTFDYKETVVELEKIYQSCKYDRRIIVVPTGSKLQTFGVFLFKQMHPDIQIIYPVTKKFSETYTEGYKTIWEIALPSFSEFVSLLDRYRKKGLDELNRAIQLAEMSNTEQPQIP